jgi:hypothetical protein
MVLLAVLVILLVLGGASASFVWFMNRQQSVAGLQYRRAAAMAVAEAGVHRALSILETVTPDGRAMGRTWRTSAYSEPRPVGHLEGRFTISLADHPEGAISITSVGEVPGATRRLRARVFLAPPALLAGIYGAGLIRLERPPATTFVLPYGAGIGDRPWTHIAAGRGIWFATTDVSINDQSVTLDVGSGPLDPAEGAILGARLPRPGPVRILLARGAELLIGRDLQRVDIQQLRAMGVHVEGVVLRAEALHPLPEVDRTYFRGKAMANPGNASLNQAAGKYLGDGDLERKRDSLYTDREFEKVRTFLKAGLAPPRLQGIVYVTGAVSLLEGDRLDIVDGALIAESTVYLSNGAFLTITHTAATRTLPGLLVLGNGALFVSERARLRAHGLVYASRLVDVEKGAQVDVVGALVGNDRGLSVRNASGQVVVRYDPAVLGTPGLYVGGDAPVVAWVATWEELP